MTRSRSDLPHHRSYGAHRSSTYAPQPRAVVLYYPYILSLHENRPLASFDNNTTRDKHDFLSLWLSHILQNHNLSQSMPQ
jgi:hypothetical protein